MSHLRPRLWHQRGMVWRGTQLRWANFAIQRLIFLHACRVDLKGASLICFHRDAPYDAPDMQKPDKTPAPPPTPISQSVCELSSSLSNTISVLLAPLSLLQPLY